MGVRVSVLGSGSRGNACLLATSRTRILIDAGFSRRELLLRMRVAAGEDASDATAADDAASLDAILITHEHSDHVAGLPRFAAGVAAPVCLTAGTRAAMGAAGETLERVETIAAGVAFTIGDIEVTPFSIPHDAADPVAFAFRAEGVRVVIVTDLGYLTANVVDQIHGADCLIIESNHDLEMLKTGSYPWELKQRVLGRLGHLSNDTLAGFFTSGFDGAAAHIVLAHLSENNNLPHLARLSAERALAPRNRSPRLHVASQGEPLAAICF